MPSQHLRMDVVITIVKTYTGFSLQLFGMLISILNILIKKDNDELTHKERTINRR